MNTGTLPGKLSTVRFGGLSRLAMSDSETTPPKPREDRMFTTTRWTMVSQASDVHGSDRMEALTHLCETYRPAILAFLRSSGKGREDAEDLTQQFFYQLLTKNTLSRAQSSRGKFRSFLLACVTNFSRDQYHREQALKRGGGVQFEPIIDHEPTSQRAQPDQVFDRTWAETVIDHALKRVEKEWLDGGKPFEELKCYLVEAKGEVPFEEKAVELGISKAALKSAVHRLRQRYVGFVREIVAETIAEGDSVEDELQCLLAILSD